MVSTELCWRGGGGDGSGGDGGVELGWLPAAASCWPARLTILPRAPALCCAAGEEGGLQVVLHEDKKFYPTAEETYGKDTETLVQEEDAQPLEVGAVQRLGAGASGAVMHACFGAPCCMLDCTRTLEHAHTSPLAAPPAPAPPPPHTQVPILAPIRAKRLEVEGDALRSRYSTEFLTSLLGTPELIRNVAVVGHLHHGKTLVRGAGGGSGRAAGLQGCRGGGLRGTVALRWRLLQEVLLEWSNELHLKKKIPLHSPSHSPAP